MTSTEPLIEAIARAIFDAENEWRRMQDGLAGQIMDDRCFKVSTVEWQMKARAALLAIEQSGTHCVVPKEPTPEMRLAYENNTYRTRMHGHPFDDSWPAVIAAARPKVTQS